MNAKINLLLALSFTFCATGLGIQTANAQLDSVNFKPDVVYGHKDGMALTFDLFEPKVNRKGIGLLLMVSGGWVSSWREPQQMLPMFQHLVDNGYTVLTIRHGSSPKYFVPECVSDVQLALDYVSKHANEWNIDATRLGVFGYSAGGHLSLMLGTVGGISKKDQPIARVAAVVAVFPPTDLAPYVDFKSPRREQFPALQFDPSKAETVSPLLKVTADDAPTLLVHGDKDELVPIWHSEKIHEAFQSAKVDSKLVVIEGAAHGFNAEGNQRMNREMLEWFNNHLANPSK